MADHTLTPLFDPEIGLLLEEIRGFHFNRLHQKRSGASAQNLGEQIAKRPWPGRRNQAAFCHGVSFD